METHTGAAQALITSEKALSGAMRLTLEQWRLLGKKEAQHAAIEALSVEGLPVRCAHRAIAGGM
jgi:hypothetical protein